MADRHLNATEDDILEARELAASMSLETVRSMMANVLAIHDGDPNFPFVTLQNIKEFLGKYRYEACHGPLLLMAAGNDGVVENPEKHERLILEMKLEAALITNNSPYAEVRAVVDNTDDPAMLASTIRAWVLGVFFSVVLASINQLFSIRQPSITIDTNIAQLLAFPLGKAWERWMPRYEFTIPFIGIKINLNPGRFNKKEHMLIAIMAHTSKSLPYSNNLVWIQILPQYFNQPYARSYGYMFLNAFSTNFIGYGLAGLTRKFLVYPSYCVWPMSLVTIALNSALHSDNNLDVMGPFNKTWTISRYRFFMYTAVGAFVYFWFPNYLFQLLTYFSWMTWIAPNNLHLNILTGMQNGMGVRTRALRDQLVGDTNSFGLQMFNPVTTLDWNAMCHSGYDPLMVPSFASFNAAAGMFIAGLCILGIWYTNTWNTAYLPINTNRAYDHFGKLYNVTATLDKRGMFDLEKYSHYSAPYMSAAQCLVYGMFFSIYGAVVTHVILYHRYEISMGFRNIIKGFRFKRNKAASESAQEQTVEGEYMDVHNRLMSVYPEGTASSLLTSSLPTNLTKARCSLGMVSLANLHLSCRGAIVSLLQDVRWPPFTDGSSGILLCLIFVIPIGIVMAMTGMEVTLNVLAEFIGGSIVEGNALAMNFFKSYGYVTCSHAVHFANDLKIAHYLHIPPRVTFAAQLVATLVSTLVCTGIMKFQMDVKDVCTKAAPMRFYCPGPNTFFTASVLWGTIGPLKVFGKDGQYKWLLLGFPAGILLVAGFWGLRKMWPNSRALRQVHVVAAVTGALDWAPYSTYTTLGSPLPKFMLLTRRPGFAYMWPNVPVAWLSWIYIRGRYLSFWSKYNFVLSASLSAGIAISGTLMLFSVQWAGVKVDWWGNSQAFQGCEETACKLLNLAKGERFYPWWDGSKVPAP
ncbi:Sexual differentiation process protein isp4 [Tolypocladium capitatum]|uniref:Sexual differentiation process protein isp4 n=1 Tax=Tolypocladium capitatum TaxID=45235 RepID=A0A2K3QIX5_9HYPO|nr:Sexual differentiation process protein isp4 [Tolypocladium capitatum]